MRMGCLYDSFLCSTARLWNDLPASVFPPSYVGLYKTQVHSFLSSKRPSAQHPQRWHWPLGKLLPLGPPVYRYCKKTKTKTTNLFLWTEAWRKDFMWWSFNIYIICFFFYYCFNLFTTNCKIWSMNNVRSYVLLKNISVNSCSAHHMLCGKAKSWWVGGLLYYHFI